MKCILMNKNTEILVAEYDSANGVFSKIYEVYNDEIKNEEVLDTNGSGHGALAEFLVNNNVDVLICGGIGGGAKNALSDNGIKLYGGVSGSADEAVRSFIADKLNFNPDVHCDHHDHEHGDENHQCGSHGCGRHGCH